jgi:GAF domain-containing protein/ActR/RegA family two-component response regulator
MAETAMHILLIEDETAHAEIIRRAFEVYTKPVRLTVTSSLQQARTRLAEFVPDLIIADLRLPDGDGFELLPGEKEEARYPVVIMTSHGDEKAAVETMKAGAFDYVVKSDDTLAAMPHMAERALREWGNIVERRRAEAELEGRARQQAVVAGLGQSALAETDLMVLMNETVCLVSETLEVEHCEILELLPGGNHLFMRAGAGWQEGLVGIATVEVITDSHAGFTLQADGPVIVAELQSETRFKAPLLLQRHGVVSGMSVNIAGHEGPFGILGAYSRQRRIFSKNDSHFLQAMANVLAAAIGRIRAEENIRHRNRELTLLNRVIAASAASSELESILETVCLELTRAFDLSQAVIALLNREKMVVEVAAERLTEDSPSLSKQPIPIANNPLVEYLSHHKAPLAIEDAQNEPLLVSFHNLLHQRATISVLILPLIVEDKLVGALSLGATQPRTFTPEEINLTGRVAEQVAGVLARASLDEERRRLEAQYQQAQKMESVGRLAAGIAHTSKPPLRYSAKPVNKCVSVNVIPNPSIGSKIDNDNHCDSL